ncbi:hypothetical protein Tco_0588988 [Tanacetum coccineum]
MVISSPCLTDIKNWLVQKQTAFGKDFSNPFTADSLLKTIWFSTHHASHAPCYSNEALAIPEQTATGKEISNPFMAGEDCWVLEDFTTYCCWFNIGAASEDLVLLRKIEENSLTLEIGRYAVLEGSDMMYWVTLNELHDYNIMEYSSSTSLYDVLGLVNTTYWLEIVFALNVDQNIIYGVSAEVDTEYSSKSGNGLEFI